MVSVLLISLSVCATALKDLFQFSMGKEDFERTVRYFVWKGRENYISRRQMKAAIDKAKDDTQGQDFDLPEWDRFLHIMRLFLDAPESIATLPFLTKEVAFRWVTPKRADPDEHLCRLFGSNTTARQFVFACANYFVHATKIPKEFLGLLESEINELLAGGSTAVSDTLFPQ